MKKGDKVVTVYGLGTVKIQEAEKGCLSNRFCIELDIIPDGGLGIMHCKQGGLYFHKSELQTENDQLDTEISELNGKPDKDWRPENK